MLCVLFVGLYNLIELYFVSRCVVWFFFNFEVVYLINEVKMVMVIMYR